MFSMIQRILAISGKHKHRILLGIGFNFLKSVSIGITLLAVFIFFENIQSLTMTVIWQVVWILLASIAGRFLFQWLTDTAMSATGFDIFRDYRLTVGEKLKAAPMGYFSEQRLGTVQSILTSTVVELEQYTMMAITDITGGVSMAVIIIVMLSFYSIPMALLSLTGLVLGLWVLRTVQKRATLHTKIVQVAQEKMVSEVLEYVRGISVMRTFLQDKEGQASVYQSFEDRRRAAYDQEHASAGILKLYSLVFKLASCGLLFLAVALHLRGDFPLSYCLMFLFSAFLVYAELETMSDGAFLARKIHNELDRLETIAKVPTLDRTQETLTADTSDIELKDVVFAYDNQTIIHDLSLTVPQGSTCAIVGPSGSGKTTICNLIARFWDVQQGEVLVGGQPVKEYTADSLLSRISMVFQNVYLFHDTIENNIRFGNPKATKDEVIEAAKRACCHDFILEMPKGYDTVVGEGGSTLSGGEKQRISIARAILKDSPIIILDEATSSVDPENEYALLEAINELTKGKTLITIAHRLSTVRTADQIVVMDSGRIVQQGDHQTLSDQEGIYRRFLDLRARSLGWQL